MDKICMCMEDSLIMKLDIPLQFTNLIVQTTNGKYCLMVITNLNLNVLKLEDPLLWSFMIILCGFLEIQMEIQHFLICGDTI